MRERMPQVVPADIGAQPVVDPLENLPERKSTSADESASAMSAKADLTAHQAFW